MSFLYEYTPSFFTIMKICIILLCQNTTLGYNNNQGSLTFIIAIMEAFMNILHLEYSQFFRGIVEKLIVQSGNKAYSSRFGADIYKILAETDIDLILMGLELGDMPGEELIQKLRSSRYRTIPIILITSLETDEIKERIRGVHIDDYILKHELSSDLFEACIDRFDPN